jgi:glycosyltransferase involved in cell wall biosynthesis
MAIFDAPALPPPVERALYSLPHLTADGHRSGKSLNVMFAIHTPRNIATAVYKNTLQRADYLGRAGHRCTILTPEDFPSLRRYDSRLLPLLYPIAVANCLMGTRRDTNVAIFHSYSGWATSLLQKHFRLLADLRTSIIFHGLEPLYYQRLQQEIPLSRRYRLLHGKLMMTLLRNSSRAADMLFCLNSEEAAYLVANEWGERDRVQTVSNSVPESFFLQRKYRPRATQLLFVGQWLPMKGIAYLVEAFTRVATANPDLQLCCAGTMAPEEQVLASFPQHVRAKVNVRPRVTEGELLHLHRQSDIFVLPTLSEGFSLAVAEAMASGLPIVTTAVGAAPDMLFDRHNALLVPTRDPQALADAIADLLDDQALRDRLGHFAQYGAQRLRPELADRGFEVCFELLASMPKSSDNGLQLAPVGNRGT